MADTEGRRYDAQIVFATTSRQRDAVDAIATECGLKVNGRSIVTRELLDWAIQNGGADALKASTLTPSAPATVG